MSPAAGPEVPAPRRAAGPGPPYLHVHQLGRLVDAGGEAAAALRRHQQFVEGLAGALHPARRGRAESQRGAATVPAAPLPSTAAPQTYQSWPAGTGSCPWISSRVIAAGAHSAAASDGSWRLLPARSPSSLRQPPAGRPVYSPRGGSWRRLPGSHWPAGEKRGGGLSW